MGLKTTNLTSNFKKFLQINGGYAVIDGGLATELEAHGADLNDPLWSAKCLINSPDLIRKVHLDYLEAGANIIISASYQGTIQGFESKGFSREESEALLHKSVQIACEAREIFQKRHSNILYYDGENNVSSKQHPTLVAASVGSYGAYLADGSEYSGDYGKSVTLETLKDFHRRRVQVLAESGADLLAFETTPNKIETQAYAELLEEENINIPAWFSFNSKDGVNVVSGDSLTECVSIANSCKKVVAVGINCTPPRFIHNLIFSIKEVTEKPILIYPNSGEAYDPDKKEWVASTGVSDEDFVSYVNKWHEAGASLIGGCCRTTPRTIRAISEIILALHLHSLMEVDQDQRVQKEGFGVLLKQGAEARVFDSTFVGRRSIVKERFSKKYRHPSLDSKLTLKRLNAEARCMVKARRLGVPTPMLYAVDPLLHTLTCEFVDGPAVKEVLIDFGANGIVQEQMDDIATQIGIAVGKLHDGGLVHGDLTTSNMLVKRETNQLILIDFGLSFTSTLPEDKAVDLYVLERALLSLHSSCGNVMDKILSAYRKSSKQWSATLNKLAQVRQRGRKRTMIG